MEGIALGPALNNIGVVSGCLILVFLFITDKIVSGRRLRKAESEIERWQGVALDAMGTAKAVVPAAETVHKIVTHLPDGESGAEPSGAEGAP